MTNTTLTVDNPFGLSDGCYAKLSNNTVVGPLIWQPDKGRFFLEDSSASWYPNGYCFGTRANIISLAPTPREPVKVPEPWTVWNYFYGSYFGEVWKTKEDAIAARAKSAWVHLLEIECRVVRVHFPDGTTQEVK